MLILAVFLGGHILLSRCFFQYTTGSLFPKMSGKAENIHVDDNPES